MLSQEKFTLLIPAVVLLLFIIVIPLLYSLVMSLFDWNLQTGYPPRFVGIGNLIEAFFKDDRFLSSIWRTIIIGVPVITAQVIIGMILALQLSKIEKFRAFFTSILIIPVMVSPMISGMAWRMVFVPRYGILNYILRLLHIIGDKEIDWLGTPKLALIAVIIVEIWRMMPFVMMILLAGLQSINPELYEASAIDGASGWQQYFLIILPLLSAPLMVAILIRIIDVFSLFGTIYTLTQGGPGGATETVSYYIYQQGFKFMRIGYASLLSYVVVCVVMVLVILSLRANKNQIVEA